jgi:hypothetical protein
VLKAIVGSKATFEAPVAATASKDMARPVSTKTQVCPECQKRFRTADAVASHRFMVHHVVSVLAKGMTQCPDCGGAVRVDHLAKHRRVVHHVL